MATAFWEMVSGLSIPLDQNLYSCEEAHDGIHRYESGGYCELCDDYHRYCRDCGEME